MSAADEADAVGIKAAEPVLVVTAPGGGGGIVTEVLASRGRQVRLVDDPAALPDGAEGLRALAVVAAAPAPTEGAAEAVPASLDALVAACHAADVPVIGIGTGALTVAAAAGLAEAGPAVAAQTLVTMQRTTPGDDDPLVATMPDGAHWLRDVAAALAPADPDHVLATSDDGEVAALASGRTYAVLPRIDLDGPAVVAALGEAAPQGVEPFLTAYATAMVGRWVDLVVGRVEEEMPWGRRGPQPVAAPGLVLNPA